VKSKLSKFFSNHSNLHRRQGHQDLHDNLEQKGVDCFKCVGTCCTFEANSMKIGPLQAVEIVEFFFSQGSDLKEIYDSCEKSIKSYRLDQNLGLSKSSQSFRRTYTCPFYKQEVFGCRVSRDSRPFGCLAFNPLISNQTKGGECKHSKQVKSSPDQQSDGLSKELFEYFGWLEDSLPIPVAVVSVLNSDLYCV
jgi:hypothetical protein